MRPFPAISRRGALFARSAAIVIVLALAGCATTGPGRVAGRRPPTRAADRAAAARQRRAAAAARQSVRASRCRIDRVTPTAARARRGTERKDAARFGADGNYRTGWQDGLALCRKK